ncbi:MAG: multicopper oxidase domain-containing protein, partial [Candidatus Sulfotelmatobacter sp.]
VRWYLLGMGNEIDLHTPHWHGETVSEGGRNTDVIELLPGSMKTVDMIADNPGTWMFHCHVEDHMENGMMAVYTIYAPPARPCPVVFAGGDFWLRPENFTLAVKNTGNKTITSLRLTPEMFLAPQDLRRPFNAEWSSAKPIPPGQEQTLEKAGIPAASAHEVIGWVFFPSFVKYEDGSIWTPQSEGECFSVIWRDAPHPQLLALPPRQVEMNPD